MDLASRAYILLGFIVLLGVLAGGILYAGKKIQEKNNQGGTFSDLDAPVAKKKKVRTRKEKTPKPPKSAKPAAQTRQEKKAQTAAGVLPFSTSPSHQSPAPSTPMQAPMTPQQAPVTPQQAPVTPRQAPAAPASQVPLQGKPVPPRTTSSPFSTHDEGDSEW